MYLFSFLSGFKKKINGPLWIIWPRWLFPSPLCSCYFLFIFCGSFFHFCFADLLDDFCGPFIAGLGGCNPVGGGQNGTNSSSAPEANNSSTAIHSDPFYDPTSTIQDMTSGCVGVGIGSSNNVKTKKIMYDLAGDLNDGLDESGYIEKKQGKEWQKWFRIFLTLLSLKGRKLVYIYM